MAKTMIINGRRFEIIKSNMHPVAPICDVNPNEIFEVYRRPSSTKIKIWNGWLKWRSELLQNNDNIESFGLQIANHNTDFFTISGCLVVEGKCYDVWITHAHNRIYIHNYK